MKTILRLPVCCMLVLLFALPAYAAPVKVYVGEINVVGGQNRDELKAALQPLLASHLSGDGLLAVTYPAEADALVSGTYVAIGKEFSFNAVISLPEKKTVAVTYVQGNEQDQLMTSIDKLAANLRPELLKVQPKAVAAPVSGGRVDISQQRATGKTVLHPELPTTLIALAAAERAGDGSRFVFAAEPNRIYCYRLQGKGLHLVEERKLPLYKNVLYLDTLPLEDGSTALLVTIMGNEQLVSQVWRVDSTSGNLKLLLDNCPYFLRAVALNGGQKKLYVQKLGVASPFIEPIYAAVMGADGITLQAPLSLPKQTSLYSFGQFVDKSGTQLTVIQSVSGQLEVYNKEMVKVWHSAEEYGQSELYIEKADGRTQDPLKLYLKQRVAVTADGEVVVSKNDALPLLGIKMGLSNGRNYGLAWDGSELISIWHTGSTENYIADFVVDPVAREHLQLEINSRRNMLSRGNSVITLQPLK